jgi:hypothetical protein
MTWPDGSQVWYQHGELHRINGPAVTWPDGRQAWYQHGELHRINGPAVIRPDGHQGWYVHGRSITGEVVEWLQNNGLRLPFTPEPADLQSPARAVATAFWDRISRHAPLSGGLRELARTMRARLAAR